MAIVIKQAADILPSEITSESNYLNRRQLMGAAGAMAMGCRLV